jgi:predicted nucleic acid-binding protein
MSDFFDSSWLIGALIEDEQHHEVCLKKLDESISKGSAKAARHSLAEVFHTITGKKGLPPQQASELLLQNFSQVRWTEVTEDDYWQSVKSAHTRGVRGGAIFDLLLLRVAERENAERIHTLNQSHFMLFAPHLASRVCGPLE